MRSARSRSTAPVRTPDASTTTVLGPSQRTSAPNDVTISRKVRTSRMRGMLCSVTGSDASTVAARHGRAAFLLPAGRIRPSRRSPPSTANVPIVSENLGGAEACGALGWIAWGAHAGPRRYRSAPFNTNRLIIPSPTECICLTARIPKPPMETLSTFLNKCRMRAEAVLLGVTLPS
jgi:hypothetical protein